MSKTDRFLISLAALVILVVAVVGSFVTAAVTPAHGQGVTFQQVEGWSPGGTITHSDGTVEPYSAPNVFMQSEEDCIKVIHGTPSLQTFLRFKEVEEAQDPGAVVSRPVCHLVVVNVPVGPPGKDI